MPSTIPYMPVFCKLGIVKNIQSNILINLLFSISSSKETVKSFLNALHLWESTGLCTSFQGNLTAHISEQQETVLFTWY